MRLWHRLYEYEIDLDIFIKTPDSTLDWLILLLDKTESSRIIFHHFANSLYSIEEV
jgi:hypothetical protein